MARPLAFAAVASVGVAAVIYSSLHQPAPQDKGDKPRSVVADRQPAPADAAIEESDGAVAPLDECETPTASRWFVSQQMEKAIDDYLQLLVASGHSDLEVALVRDLATSTGIHEHNARGSDDLGTRPSGREVVAPDGPPPPNARWLTMLERDSFAEAFDRNGVRGVLSVANGDPTVLHARWGDTTLLGHLIGRDGTRFWRLSRSELAEVSLGIHELVAAIKASSAVADFRSLLEAASVSDSEVSELARIAALHGRPRILRQLIDLGAVPPRGGSILDDLATHLRPAPPDSAADYSEVVRLLVAAGDQPYLPSSLAVIQFRLPDAELVTLHESTLAVAQDPTIEVAAAGFVALLQDWWNRLDVAETKEEICWDRSRSASSPDSPSSSLGVAQRLDHQRELSRRLEQSPEYEEAARFLSRLEDVLEAALDSGDLERWRLEAFDRMLDLANAGRWEQAIAAAKELQEAYPHLLHIALTQGASIDVVAELIDHSGGLPEDAVMTLVSRSLNLKAWSGADEIVKALAETRGLDVHYVDPAGHNALTQTAEYFYDLADLRQVNDDAFRLVQYLVDQSVTMKPTPQGLDALDRVLLKVLETPQTLHPGIGFLRYLIDHGAPVERSHRQVAGMISHRNPEGYSQLVEALPELRSDSI